MNEKLSKNHPNQLDELHQIFDSNESKMGGTTEPNSIPQLEEDEHDIVNLGVFVNRNIHIAPHFKEYSIEKSRILQQVKVQNRWNVNNKLQSIENQQRQQSKFNLIKWEVYRFMEKKRLEIERANKIK
jgi:hypothetical protein